MSQLKGIFFNVAHRVRSGFGFLFWNFKFSQKPDQILGLGTSASLKVSLSFLNILLTLVCYSVHNYYANEVYHVDM